MSTLAAKKDWLEGPGDLKESVVEDVPVPGKSVKVRGLAAAFSTRAASDAVSMRTVAGSDTQETYVDRSKMECIQFAHGVIDPEFTVEEATLIAEKYGPAFAKVIAEIDRLSAVDKEAIDAARKTVPASGTSENGRSEVEAPGGAGAD